MKKLTVSTLQTFVIGVVVLGLLIFLPAGTLNYWQGWVFIVVFALATNAIGIYLAIADPVLLERRKHIGPTAEQSTAQKLIISLSFLWLFGVMVFAAFDHRLGWSPVPASVSIIGNVLVALGLFVDLLVFRENSYGGSTVQTFDGQKVIATGPYALVRHPMYLGVLIMVVGIPLALDSWWGLGIIAVILPVLIWRILDEERLLKHDLPGYAHYTHQVQYRLVPYLW